MDNKKSSGLYAEKIRNGTLNINGQSFNVKTIRDNKGNVVYTSITPKIFGIF